MQRRGRRIAPGAAGLEQGPRWKDQSCSARACMTAFFRVIAGLTIRLRHPNRHGRGARFDQALKFSFNPGVGQPSIAISRPLPDSVT
jgi:hypothetical protein